MKNSLPFILIVGGGAGGLPLVAKLSKTLVKKQLARVALIDASPTYLWKPLLHEVAAGTLSSYDDEINYFNYTKQHGLEFYFGSLQSLNRAHKKIILASMFDEQQQEIIPARQLSYDILVLAIGSKTNDFDIPGAKEYCYFLDNRAQADRFHQVFLQRMLRMAYQSNPQPLQIAIVGGGATGVELIAELHYAAQQFPHYELNVSARQIQFSLIESADKILTLLPENLSADATLKLKQMNVAFYLQERVISVTEQGLHTATGKFIPADLMIWTAGIKAPDFLKSLDGLEVNKQNQLIVRPTLQTTIDKTIFAFGDCAFCPQPDINQPVPPRAQAAQQQAAFLAKTLYKYLNNKALPSYRYRDYGSLISLGQSRAIGNIMNRTAKNIFLRGKIARFTYLFLYKRFQAILFGWWGTFLLTIARLVNRRLKARLKLH